MCKPRLSLFRVMGNLVSRLVYCLLNAISTRNWRCSSVMLAFFSLKHPPYLLSFLFVCRINNFKKQVFIFLCDFGLRWFWPFCCSNLQTFNALKRQSQHAVLMHNNIWPGFKTSSKNLPLFSCLGVEDGETAQMNIWGGAELVSPCQRSDWLSHCW